MRTIIEPFRIKSVDPIVMTTREERERHLREADYNLFKIPARAVMIDLLTDSGTGAMSAEQWAAIMRGDESYAGSPSFFVLKEAVKRRFGFDEFMPVHQGRAAERILFHLLGGPGKVILGNTHFDTTRANIEMSGAEAVDIPVASALDPSRDEPFKGNIDIEKLKLTIRARGAVNISALIMTITNNAVGGQPVSLANLRAAREICHANGIPLFLDAARFAENAYLAKLRDPELSSLTIAEIVLKYFEPCDGFLLSAKKDALCHVGGLLGIRDPELAARARTMLVVTEGFPTYGGLAGRDLEAMARGLEEAIDFTYLAYRAAVTSYISHGLITLGVPHVRPPGLHAIYIDAGKFLPHIPPGEFPGHALAVELYRIAGVRGCEIGSLMRGDNCTLQLLRLAIPRRGYTQSHMDYLLEAFEDIVKKRGDIRGYRIVDEPPALRHFTARIAPIGNLSVARPPVTQVSH
ncbi:MAG: tryptophanase [Planctomycetes bacterium]|nr:tryptophanase [Planctomycetota bacterium]